MTAIPSQADATPGAPGDDAPEVHVLNGPNLNLLGRREPGIYGTATLAGIEARCRQRAAGHGLRVVFRQTNHEGELVDWIQAASGAAGLVINAAGLSYGSVPVVDALRALTCPVIEVHLSNIHAREAYRQHSDLSPCVLGVIAGLGGDGYVLAMDALAGRIRGEMDAAA